jgi:transposase
MRRASRPEANLKRFRAIATRYDKTARNFLALVQLACARLWLEN